MDRYDGCLFQRPLPGKMVAESFGDEKIRPTGIIRNRTAKHHLGRLYVTTALVAVGVAVATSPADAAPEGLRVNDDQAANGVVAWNLADANWLDEDGHQTGFQNGDWVHLDGDGAALTLELTESVETGQIAVSTSRYMIASRPGAVLSSGTADYLGFHFEGSDNILAVDATLSGRIDLQHADGGTGGRLVYSGDSEIGGAELREGTTLVVSGRLALQGGQKFTLRTGAALEVSGEAEGDVQAVASGAGLDVAGGRLSGNVTDVDDMAVRDGGRIDGTVSVGEVGSLVMENGAHIGRVESEGQVDFAGDVGIGGGNGGGVHIGQDGRLRATEADSSLEIDTGGRLENYGVIGSSAAVTRVRADEIILHQGSGIAGNLDLEGAVRLDTAFDYTGADRISGDLRIGDTGAARVDGDVTHGGAIVSRGVLEVAQGSRLAADGVAMSRGEVEISGRLDSDLVATGGDLVVRGTGQIDGRIDLDNDAGLALRGGETGAINLAGQSTASLRGKAQGLDIGADAAAFIDVGGDNSLTIGGAGPVTNAGRLTVGTGTRIGGADIVNTGRLDLDGQVRHVTNGGDILVSDTGDGRFAGMQNAGGRVEIAAGGKLTDTSDSGIANSGGNLVVGGELHSDVQGGQVRIAGTGRVTGDVTGAGQVTSSGQVSGTLGILGTGTLNGGGAGRLEAGTAADVTIRNTVGIGSLRNDGDITLVDDARLVVSGSDARTGASGRLSIDQGATLVADTLQNDGLLSVRGTVEGDVVAASGSTVLLDGGRLTGRLDLAGDAALAGRIDGRLSGTGAAVGTGDLSLGQLQLTGDGSLVMADGRTLTLAGASSLHDAARLEIGADGRLVGNLRLQDADSLLVLGPEAEVTGTLDNSGTIRLTGTATINGDLTNRNLLELDAGSRGELHIDGIFYNPLDSGFPSGRIRTNGGELVIYADEVRNKHLLDYDDGVIFAALLHNTAHWDIDGVERIHGDFGLVNSGSGYLHLLDGGSLQMDGSRLENRAEIMVETGGEVVEVGRLENEGRITIRDGGLVEADRLVNNGSGAEIDNRGLLQGTVVNRDDATLISTGIIDGRIENAANANLAGTVGSLINRDGGHLFIGADNALAIDDDLLLNERGGRVVLFGQLDSALVQNDAGADFIARADSRLNGRLVNEGWAVVSGTAREVENHASMVAGRDGALVLDQTLENRASGQLQVEGKLSLADGNAPALRNEGEARITNTGTVAGLENHGRLDLAGAVAGMMQNADGAEMRVTSSQAVVDDLQNDAGGALMIGQGNRLSVTGVLQNDGILVSQGRLSGEVINTGEAVLSGRLDGLYVQAGGATRIDGTLRNSGELRVETGALHIEEGQTLRGISPSGDPDEARGFASIGEDGSLRLDGRILSDVRNRGVLVAGATAQLGGVLVNDGVADLDGNLDRLVNGADGAVLIDDGAALRLGEMESDGLIEVRPDGSMTLTGPAENRGGMLVAGRVDGRLTNSGRLDLTGNMTDLVNTGEALIKGGRVENRVDNQGHVIVAGQSSVNQLDNSGVIAVGANARLTIDDRLDIRAGGQMLIAEDGRADGRLVNHGEFRSDGQLSGTFRNTGTAVLSGQAETVRNQGVMAIDGRIDVGLMVNSDLLEVGAGSHLWSQSLVHTHAGGRTRVAGRVTAAMRVREGGLLVTDANAHVEGKVTNEGIARLAGQVEDIANKATGTLRVTGDLVANRVDNAGRAIIMDGATLSMGRSLINQAGALLMVQQDGVVATSVESAGEISLAGTITGTVISAGDVTGRGGLIGKDLILKAGGTVTDDITVAGDVLIDGAMQIGGTVPGARLLAADPGLLRTSPAMTSVILADNANIVLADDVTRINSDARLAVRGRLEGDQVLNAGALVVEASGLVGGDISNWGDFVLKGVVQGNVIHEAGDLAFDPSGRITRNLVLNRDYTLVAGQQINAAGVMVSDDVRLSVYSTVTAELHNLGAVEFATGASVTGGLFNGGVIRPIAAGSGQDQIAIAGGMHNEGVVDLTNDRTGDLLLVDGGISGSGIYRLDADLTASESDMVQVSGGAVTGTLFFDVERTGSHDHVVGRSVTLLKRDGGFTSQDRFSYNAKRLPDPTERIVYVLARDDAAGKVQLLSRANPAIGAISGNVALTQGLISTVINRPSSPYVTGLGFSAENACRVGSWGRAVGGRADITGATRDLDMPDGGVLSVDSVLRANYRGLQVGTDFGCYDGRFSDWTIVGGAIIGFNTGTTRQPVHGVDPGTGQAIGPVTSVNKAKFDQTYAGLYASAMRGPLVMDLQLRHERTDFTLDNIPEVAGTGGLGLSNAKFRSRATTVSGSIAYNIGLGAEDSGWSLTPTAGFGWSKGRTGTITFDDASTLQIDDRTTKVVFAGAGLSRARPASDGQSALALFASGTYYRDFGSRTTSTFTLMNADGTKAVQKLESDNLGNYGELSIGASYVRILDGSGPIKQLNATIRLDGRTGKALDSFGVTGQMRLQF